MTAHDLTPSDRRVLISGAIAKLREARDHLRRAGASDRCVERVRRAIESAEGAQRHAQTIEMRETIPAGCPVRDPKCDERGDLALHLFCEAPRGDPKP